MRIKYSINKTPESIATTGILRKFEITTNQITMSNLQIPEQEIWKDIQNYEGYYQVSNLGKVKSVLRKIIRKNGAPQTIKERVVKPALSISNKYLKVGLWREGIGWSEHIHLLVWDHFGTSPRNGMVLTVDHIDNDKRNNRINNLQLLSNRDNLIKGHLRKDMPTGVVKENHRRKYYSYIKINKKNIYLGSYNNKEDAGRAYQNAKFKAGV